MAKSCGKCLAILSGLAVVTNLIAVVIFHQMIKTKEVDFLKSIESQNFAFQRSKSNRGKHDNSLDGTDVWLAGIIIDVDTIADQIWNVILELNCRKRIGIHIIAKHSSEFNHGLVNRSKFQKKDTSESCGPLVIQQEGNIELLKDKLSTQKTTNRIDRISFLRDYQRQILMEKYPDDEANGMKRGVVILVDLDLLQIPTAKEIWDQVQKLQAPSYPHDSICALGTKVNVKEDPETKKRKPIPFYFDTYATVFLPDTFSHPLSRRLIPHHYPGEDPNFVRSDDPFHGFTQAHMWNYFRKEGAKSVSGNVDVRSCFGGMALYTSQVYFNSKCQYELKEGVQRSVESIQNKDAKRDVKTIMRYANNKELRPCEHVVLHDCLANRTLGFKIAVNPKLITIWKRR